MQETSSRLKTAARREERQAVIVHNRQRFEALREIVEDHQRMEPEDIAVIEIVRKFENMDLEPMHREHRKGKNGSSELRCQEILQRPSCLLLNDVIDDIESEWNIAPKPAGERALLIAGQNRTQLIFKDDSSKIFKTSLKGGNPNSGATVGWLLDGIYASNGAYYVLDAVVLDESPIFEECAELRHYFLNAKLGNIYSEINAENQLSIQVVPQVSATRANIESINTILPGVKLEGLLLIDKSSPYIIGDQNEDVYWLMPQPTSGSSLTKLHLRYNTEKNQLESKDKTFTLPLANNPKASVYHNSLFGTTTVKLKTKDGHELELKSDKTYRIEVTQIESGELFAKVVGYNLVSATTTNPMVSGTIYTRLNEAIQTRYAEELLSMSSLTKHSGIELE